MKRNRISIRLHDTERDRVIAGFMDVAAKDPSINISEIVKDHLYRVATGKQADDTKVIVEAIRAEFKKLPSMIRVQGAAPAPEERDDSEADEIARRLGAMPD